MNLNHVERLLKQWETWLGSDFNQARLTCTVINHGNFEQNFYQLNVSQVIR